jgi:ribosomal protein L40E
MSGVAVVTTRPSTIYVLKKKSRICGKCGAKINNQRTRCKKCSGLLPFPTKNRKRKTKHRTLKHRGKMV